MPEQAQSQHSHQDGTDHNHSTELAPEVGGFLQKVEQFISSLDPNEQTAMRRIMRAGQMAGLDTIDAVSADTAGYHWDPYTGYNHVHYTQGYPLRYVAIPAAVAVPVAVGYYVYPWWYPSSL
jgi:hypothetical protein